MNVGIVTGFVIGDKIAATEWLLIGDTTPSASKKRLYLVLGVVAALIALAAAIPAIHSAIIHESTDDAFIDGHIVSISSKVDGQVTAVSALLRNSWSIAPCAAR